jgi:hypothetical protein
VLTREGKLAGKSELSVIRKSPGTAYRFNCPYDYGRGSIFMGDDSYQGYGVQARYPDILITRTPGT